jgi:spermidine synthase
VVRWELLDVAEEPGGAAIHLVRRGDEFSIRVDGHELMNSRAHASEEALPRLACAALRGRAGLRVLVGGLGMGFTLAALLKLLGPDDRVEVAEVVPAVVEWNRGVLAHLSGRALDDPRAAVVVDDVGRVLRSRPAAWDAVLLDVDNGPVALGRPGNAGLYSPAGLAVAAAALRPGGVLAVWSADRNGSFRRRLREGGFEVAEHRVHRHGERGPTHVIWVARVRPPRA